MELVYLWVEKYKNIRKQGFNFSPKFECKYENNKLTICDKKKKECKDNNYIEKFFGDNINVTAIVGKNGSGKSSVLNLLKENLSPLAENYIVVLNVEAEMYVFTTLAINPLCRDMEVFNLNNLNYNDVGKLKTLLDEKIIFTPIDSAYNAIHLIYFTQDNKHQEFFGDYFTPKKAIADSSVCFLSEKTKNLEEEFKNLKKLRENLGNHSMDFFFYSIYIYISNQIVELKDSFPELAKVRTLKEYQEILDESMRPPNMSKWGHDFDSTQTRKEIHERVSDDLYYIRTLFNEKEYFSKFIKFTFNLYQFELNIEKLDFSKAKDKFFIKWLPTCMKLNFIDEKHDLSFNDLSSGEQAIINIRANLEHFIDFEQRENHIFLMDEPSNSLHPQWEKKFIKYIYDVFSRQKNKNFNFIITSHSPFMISDLPKENVIFLDTYENEKTEKKYPKLKLSEDIENGYCVNVSKEINLNTFGQNIHTLLSDAFFMEDGLMGEFALQKIQKVVDFYIQVQGGEKESKDYTEEIKKEFYFIRDNIGEEYIKGVITNHIEFIEQELGDESFKKRRIEQLKKELDELEGNNDKN